MPIVRFVTHLQIVTHSTFAFIFFINTMAVQIINYNLTYANQMILLELYALK